MSRHENDVVNCAKTKYSNNYTVERTLTIISPTTTEDVTVSSAQMQ